VSWILDADIAQFFDTIEHDWLIKFIEHRVADARIVRLIRKWLNAGVLEEGRRTQSEVGTVQGGSISPLLANIYLHYAFDLWVKQWRQRHARGDVIAVRYADDWVAGFQFRDDAERFQQAVAERLHSFGLALHPDKTRLIEFGRFARDNRRRRGQAKPQTFDFLGFTHCCGQTRKGRFMVLRLTRCQTPARQTAGGQAGTQTAHAPPIAEQGQFLRAVVGRSWPLLRRAVQRRAPEHVPLPGRSAVAPHPVPPQPVPSSELASHASLDHPLASRPAHLPPVPEPASDRPDPRQEPYAVAPHVRIRGGGAGRLAFLLRLTIHSMTWSARSRCQSPEQCTVRDQARAERD